MIGRLLTLDVSIELHVLKIREGFIHCKKLGTKQHFIKSVICRSRHTLNFLRFEEKRGDVTEGRDANGGNIYQLL